jgi:putative CocE/NonD family hydrolase
MYPVVPGNEIYRDTAFPGGMPGAEFALLYLGLTGSLNLANPAFTNPDPSDLALAELQHIAGFLNYHVPTLATAVLGGDVAYDQQYWRARSPLYGSLQRIVRNRIPVKILGGWHDLFGRGEPLDYTGLQNAAAGRPVGASMSPREPVDPRFQLVMGPWYHVTAGKGFDLERSELQWFDRWLKGKPTGVDKTRSPLWVYALGSGRWIDAAHFPFARAKPTTWYLAAGPSGSGAPSPNDGRLTTVAPTGGGGADPMLWTGLTSPCNGSAETWSAGFYTAIVTGTSSDPDPTANPCARDDRQRQVGPGALTYTTAPVSRPILIAGPIGATIYMTSTRPETELVATLEDVAPDGTSTPLNNGALLGSQRALDPARSWIAPGGRPLLPYHPFTRASQVPVPIGAVTRYDIEIFSTVAELETGHRLRLTLNSGDSPRILPTSQQFAGLLGGVYSVQHSAEAPSSLTAPVAAPDALDTPGAVPCRRARHCRRRPLSAVRGTTPSAPSFVSRQFTHKPARAPRGRALLWAKTRNSAIARGPLSPEWPGAVGSAPLARRGSRPLLSCITTEAPLDRFVLLRKDDAVDGCHHRLAGVDSLFGKDRHQRLAELLEVLLGLPDVKDLEVVALAEAHVDGARRRGASAGGFESRVDLVVLRRVERRRLEVHRDGHPLSPRGRGPRDPTSGAVDIADCFRDLSTPARLLWRHGDRRYPRAR